MPQHIRIEIDPTPQNSRECNAADVQVPASHRSLHLEVSSLRPYIAYPAAFAVQELEYA